MDVNVSKITLDRFLHLYFLYHFLHLLIFVDVNSIVIWALTRETPRLHPVQHYKPSVHAWKACLFQIDC
jgi:hypothetical protein